MQKMPANKAPTNGGDTDEKIRARTAHDLDYIENWSILFDLKILFLTPIRLLNTDNAY